MLEAFFLNVIAIVLNYFCPFPPFSVEMVGEMIFYRGTN